MTPSFPKAAEYLLSNETYTRNGKIVSNFEDKDSGEISNWGISLKWLQTIDPEATAETIRNLTREVALDLYYKHWWKANRIDMLATDNVAAKVLDMCVNCGAGTGIKMLQNALNEPLENPAEHLAVDGVIGPKVAAAVEFETTTKTAEFGLLSALVSQLESHYDKIVEKNPKLKKNLPTWKLRAEKLPNF